MKSPRSFRTPEVIVSGMDTLRVGEDSNLEEEITQAGRELRAVQLEEDRAIRLYVSEKITEAQLDRQRQFITERLEHFRVRLEGHRARKAVADQNRVLAGRIAEWVSTVGQNLESLGSDERREVLQLMLDSVMIDGDNNVSITLAIPIQDSVAIAQRPTSCWWPR